ncbi:FAD-binding protein [Leptospira sp. severe_002]|uniref:FAD-binding protein n=1 Tax=Leptospira sp. severe_002 TaxID=2838237 RepID=UPI001E437DC9|nr:FAD-binding protein [Leptospira sp. severe_002]
MTDALKPRDTKDVENAVQWALAESKALEVVGRGSKRALGRPSQTDLTLDLSGLSGVTLYEPEELVLSARAGTPIAEIEALVASKNQQLEFEPMDYGPLLGQPDGAGSLGGALATNLAGPRRIKSGAARDHFLGFTAVSGRGETFKSGGRVVKNVTGYDLCKVLAGSYGTLAAMTDVTIKTLPRAETEETVLVLGLSDANAIKVMSAAMASSCDVSGAAHLPAHIAFRFGGLDTTQATTALRLEGVAPSVKHRKEALIALLRSYGSVTSIGVERSKLLWSSIRDVRPFAANGPSGQRPVWRVSTVPSKGAELATLIPPSAQMFYDWAGGLIWIAPLPGLDVATDEVRAAVRSVGGHATLIRADASVRAASDVFEPQDGALAAVTKRVKESFDPKGVLNPGRMWAGV